MNYQYTYLFICLLGLIVWLALFIYRKDFRRQMLSLSIIYGFIGFLFQLVYTKDWFTPLRITNTIIGFEDFLFSFVTIGVATVIYQYVFRLKIESGKIQSKKKMMNLIGITILFLALFLISFFVLELHSFWCSVIAFLGGTFVIWIKRKDLILDSLTSGFLLTLVVIPAFWVLEIVSPGWIFSAWHIEKIKGLMILGVPVADMIWFFVAGLYLGPLYKFWQGANLKNIISGAYRQKK